MRIIVCDDIEVICDNICSLLKEFFEQEGINDIEIVGYQNGEAVLKDTGEKDIVFLDVELPGINGITVAKTLKANNPKTIVFLVTAYEQYTDDAFRINAFRFIQKPFEKDRLYCNLKEALHFYHTATGKIYVEEKNGGRTEYKSNIVFIESVDRASIIHYRDGFAYTSQTIKEWAEILNDGCFFIPHRSYIVNLHYVKSYNKNTIYFENCSETAMLTRRKLKSFKNAYKNIVKSSA